VRQHVRQELFQACGARSPHPWKHAWKHPWVELGTRPEGRCMNIVKGNAYNSKFQYAPCYKVEDFVGRDKLEGFSTDDLYIYQKNGEIAGVMGAWNQTDFKQVKINSYSKTYQLIRPLYNLFSKLKSVPPLPPVGGYIKNIYGSFIAIKEDNPKIFHELVNAIRYNFTDKGYAYLSIGFHEKHPLNRELLKLSSRELESIAYEVYWGEENPSLPKENRVPHVEIATL